MYTQHVSSSLQASFIKAVQECLSTAGQNTSASQRRKKHAELQDRLQGLWNMLHLFEKALVHFQGKFGEIVCNLCQTKYCHIHVHTIL